MAISDQEILFSIINYFIFDVQFDSKNDHFWVRKTSIMFDIASVSLVKKRRIYHNKLCCHYIKPQCYWTIKQKLFEKSIAFLRYKSVITIILQYPKYRMSPQKDLLTKSFLPHVLFEITHCCLVTYMVFHQLLVII